MTWNRPKRFAIVLFALVSLLFMQLSLAAYVCPVGGADVSGAQMADMKSAGMPCAEATAWATDDEQPTLCAAHCKADPSTPDKHELPGLAMLAAPAGDHARLNVIRPPLAEPVWAPLLARDAVPSLVVRHCCFRL